jgi:hypothetical protein
LSPIKQRLEDWIAADRAVLGMELAVIGRQIPTEHGGRIDLLALDREANCVIVELKRARTPREVVAQLLDYASWVVGLEFQDLENIAQSRAGKSLAAVYESVFGAGLPDIVNAAHHMILVAAELDPSSERIVNYLADQHGVSINAAFFSFFTSDGRELLGRAWLRDPDETVERAEKKRRPWSGFWFVNVGEGEHRNWDDNKTYGYLAAGQGEQYARSLKKLQHGDRVFAYMKGRGYVGYGEVERPAVPIKEFIPNNRNKPLLELPLKTPNAGANSESTVRSEWVVAVRWIKALDRDDARTFKGIFANPNVVCKLRDQQTVDFLGAQFDIAGDDA